MTMNPIAAEHAIAELRRRNRELEAELESVRGERARYWGAIYRACADLTRGAALVEAAMRELAAVLTKEGK